MFFTLAALRDGQGAPSPEEEAARRLVLQGGGKLFGCAISDIVRDPLAVCPPSLLDRDITRLCKAAATRDFAKGEAPSPFCIAGTWHDVTWHHIAYFKLRSCASIGAVCLFAESSDSPHIRMQC